MMMEAARSSETLVNFYQTTRRYNPGDSHLLFSLFFAVESGPLYNLKRMSILLVLGLSLLLENHEELELSGIYGISFWSMLTI
jgi:hypothetical protein